MENKTLFFKLGTFIYRYRLAVIFAWLILIVCCLPFLPHLITPFKSTGFVDEKSASAKADDYLNKTFNYNNQRILITYSSKHLRANSLKFSKALKHSLADLKNFPIKHEIIYPDLDKAQISKDKHTALVIISFTDKKPLNHQAITQLKKLIKKPSHMTLEIGGEPIFVESVNKQTEKDLCKGDLISTPVSLVILIIIFGSLIAALLPIFLGGGCALLILTTLYFFGHLFVLSIFTLNIALLLGLCLTLDYCLFIISRFRDEFHKNSSLPIAISQTLATAGKAVFFSGLAVFISLSALLIFPINILFSVGVGGLVAVFFAVSGALLLLPALLSVLKTRINALPLVPHTRNKSPTHFWRWLAKKVTKNPLIYFVLVLALLLTLAYPLLNVRFGVSDFHILPAETPGREFFEVYKQKFSENELAPILLIVTSTKENILSKVNLNKLYQFTKKLENNALITEVRSIVTTNKKLTAYDYYQLYHSSQSLEALPIKTLLKSTTRKNATMITVVSKYQANSPETKKLINQLRKLRPGKNLNIQLTGIPVSNSEVLERISSLFPYALLWIMVLTYLTLLILLRSIFLPLKAILMNIISLCASYGVLVFVFQQGHFHRLLHFEPQGMLDISLLIIIFCALFGFSMDYEVFLLTRIKEFYKKTGNNRKSIIFGIDHSSRIITSAALIVIFICGSFMVADVLMVKEFGLGIAVAIFVDAFFVRSLLVPSLMVLVRQLNWYYPKWLEKILPA